MGQIALAAAAETLSMSLPTGALRVRTEPGAWRLDDLCAFAARENPRRGFLVVSKVLGRHIPVAPALTRASARALAGLIPGDLPGPVLVIGLAETAICLGQTIHEEVRARTGRDDLFFIHSTRQRIDSPLLCRFEERHSHASAHLIYQPRIPSFTPPRSLVLVDDELSTGSTLVNLAAALVACWPGVETIRAATLTDWSDGVWLARMARPARAVCLLRGSLDWQPRTTIAHSAAFDAAAASLGTVTRDPNLGRLGFREPPAIEPRARPPLDDGPLRIIGTGEFTYAPFRLAESLAADGRDVVVQATSRSPARLGGAISSALIFGDNYGTDVPNFLYNVDPADGRANWICHETGDASIDPRLVRALDARLVGWAA